VDLYTYLYTFRLIFEYLQVLLNTIKKNEHTTARVLPRVFDPMDLKEIILWMDDVNRIILADAVVE
jgi:hypothetical protein